jgi:hypothetical protein
MYTGSLSSRNIAYPTTKRVAYPTSYNEGLGSIGAAIALVAVVAAAIGGGAAVISGHISEGDRRKRVAEAFRQLLLNRPSLNPSFLVTWPKFTEIDMQILLGVALELGLEVVAPTPVKGKANVILATSPSGSHVVVIQNPVDMAKIYNVNDKVDFGAVNAIIGGALTSKLPKSWFTPKIANDWAQKIQSAGSVTRLALRSRPQKWGMVDWMLLGGGVVVAGYLTIKVLNNRSRSQSKPSEGDILHGTATAMKNNPHASEAEINQAIDRYKKFHWGEEPSKTEEYEMADIPPVVNEHGELVGVVYKTNKRGDGETVYVHQFDNPKPKLVSGNDWKQLYIVGGGYQIAPEGIKH